MTLLRGRRPELLAGTPRREGSPPGTRRHPLPSEAFADMPRLPQRDRAGAPTLGAPGSCPPPWPICLTEVRASVPRVSRWSASWHTDRDRVPENQACRVLLRAAAEQAEPDDTPGVLAPARSVSRGPGAPRLESRPAGLAPAVHLRGSSRGRSILGTRDVAQQPDLRPLHAVATPSPNVTTKNVPRPCSMSSGAEPPSR